MALSQDRPKERAAAGILFPARPKQTRQNGGMIGEEIFLGPGVGAERLFSCMCTKQVIGRLPQREPPSQWPSSQSRVARMCASLDSPERGDDREKGR